MTVPLPMSPQLCFLQEPPGKGESQLDDWQLDIVTGTLPPTITDPMKAFIQQAQLSPSSDQDTSDTVLGNSIGFVQGSRSKASIV
jgi:hypothetical protein